MIDWASLAHEQRTLRRQMESRFRAAFPDAVAVVDPVLQMRRKISEARHAAGQPDNGDFLPMTQKVMAAMKDVPAGALRIVSYESGRMTLEVATKDESVIQRISARLVRSGLTVDPSVSARPGGPTVTITARSS
jgi:general secretion pathway protein L